VNRETVTEPPERRPESPALVSAWVRRPLAWGRSGRRTGALDTAETERLPGALLEALRERGHPWLLESALRPHPLARFSFVGADPWAVVRGFVRHGRAWSEVCCLREVHPDVAAGTGSVAGDPLETAARLLPPPPSGEPDPAENAPPFVGGAVGYLGYELAGAFEAAAPAPRHPSALPDLVLLLVDRLVAIDHETGRVWAVGLGVGRDAAEARRRAHAAAEALAASCDGVAHRLAAASGADGTSAPAGAPARAGAPGDPDGPAPATLDAGDYRGAVQAILERIAAGDVYQACLTRGLEVPFAGDPWALYQVLRRTNPAPFAAYLELPEAAVVSSSPERFLRVDAQGRVESRPIKGTRPRSADPAADAALGSELAASAKDRAENLMIVDLVRNDLGRVCRPGSVEVPELFRIEAYARVHQMVSVVRGRLAPGRHARDAVRGAFPPGSMTGAPKLAAMHLLSRLEPGPRGVYAGALGYLDVRGGADLSVVIRTILVSRGRARLHTGGGVVADSDPAAEHAEALDKAAALLEALDEARGGGALPDPSSATPGSPRGASGPHFTRPSAPALDGGPGRPISSGS